jgi:hypothetical protein
MKLLYENLEPVVEVGAAHFSHYTSRVALARGLQPRYGEQGCVLYGGY